MQHRLGDVLRQHVHAEAWCACGSTPRARRARDRTPPARSSRQFESQIREPCRTASGFTVFTRIRSRASLLGQAAREVELSGLGRRVRRRILRRPRARSSKPPPPRRRRGPERAISRRPPARPGNSPVPRIEWLRSHSSSVVSSIGALEATPAFDTTMSTPPKASAARPNASRTASSFVTSPAAVAPASPRASTAAAAPTPSRSNAITHAPSRRAPRPPRCRSPRPRRSPEPPSPGARPAAGASESL